MLTIQGPNNCMITPTPCSRQSWQSKVNSPTLHLQNLVPTKFQRSLSPDLYVGGVTGSKVTRNSQKAVIGDTLPAIHLGIKQPLSLSQISSLDSHNWLNAHIMRQSVLWVIHAITNSEVSNYWDSAYEIKPQKKSFVSTTYCVFMWVNLCLATSCISLLYVPP